MERLLWQGEEEDVPASSGKCLFLTIISINKFMLDDRLVQAKVKNEAMKAYLESEKDRAEELEGLKAEMKTRKFVEETARDKFGLAYENEIVFEPGK